jgi:hypothetical protein
MVVIARLNPKSHISVLLNVQSILLNTTFIDIGRFLSVRLF